MSAIALYNTALGPIEAGVAGEGLAVLALHGAMGGHDQSNLLARSALSVSRCRVVCVSRPGYLGTPLSSGRTPEEQADLYAALLDELGMEAAAVLAISGGGQSAVQFALRHPARCRALMLISACTAPIEAKLPLRFHLLRLAARFPWMLRAMASEQPLEARLRRAIRNPEQRARLQADADALRLFDELQGATLRHLPERMAGTLNDIANSRAPFKYPLERIAPPVLLAHGDADEVAPFAASAGFADRNAGARLLRLRDGEHVALFTHRGEVMAAVAELLDRL